MQITGSCDQRIADDYYANEIKSAAFTRRAATERYLSDSSVWRFQKRKQSDLGLQDIADMKTGTELRVWSEDQLRSFTFFQIIHLPSGSSRGSRFSGEYYRTDGFHAKGRPQPTIFYEGAEFGGSIKCLIGLKFSLRIGFE